MGSSNQNRYALIILLLAAGVSLFMPTPTTCPQEETTVTRIFEIKDLDLNQAKEEVEKILTKDEQTGACAETLTLMREGKQGDFLVVKDTADKLEQVAQLLEKLKEEANQVLIDLDFRDVPLNQILSTIAQAADLNIIGGEDLAGPISIYVKDIPLEDAFDTILKSTDYAYIKEGNVYRIISKDEMPLVTDVFELRYVSSEQMKQAVSHLLSAQGSLKSFSKFAEEDYANFLVVTDTPQVQEAISELIQRLDQEIDQVVIEVKFCEVTLNKTDQLGIDWDVQASLSGATTQTMFPIHKAGLRRLERPAELTEPAGEITLGTISFSNFAATLHALDSETKVDLIASPRIATKEGQQAEIVIGSKVPIPLYERNESTGSMEVSGYEVFEIGVLLQVTPIINKDGTVTLEIHPEVSEITGYTGPNNERPIISTRELTTVFTVEDGKTVVLGGLMRQTMTTSRDQVPFFGKIPVLGRLFRYDNDSQDKVELLIFITPHVVARATKSWEEER